MRMEFYGLDLLEHTVLAPHLEFVALDTAVYGFDPLLETGPHK